jgi:N-methylhydantoinase A
MVEMRYEGQGHEISVPLPSGALKAAHAKKLRADYEARYEQQFGLRISDVPVEFLTWSVNVSTVSLDSKFLKISGVKRKKAIANGKRHVFDPVSGKLQSIPSFPRRDLAPGMRLAGPALVVEPQTTTLVPRNWHCKVTAAGHLLLEKKS